MSLPEEVRRNQGGVWKKNVCCQTSNKALEEESK